MKKNTCPITWGHIHKRGFQSPCLRDSVVLGGTDIFSTLTWWIYPSEVLWTYHRGKLESVTEPECIVLAPHVCYVGYNFVVEPVKWVRYELVLQQCCQNPAKPRLFLGWRESYLKSARCWLKLNVSLEEHNDDNHVNGETLTHTWKDLIRSILVKLA